MKYVVTGGAGFIGSHIADFLKDAHEVVVIDDFSTGKRENLASLWDDPNVRCVEQSILDQASLIEWCEGAAGIFHQAAIPSVPRSIADPLAIHQAGLTGTLSVLLAARDSGVKKVVYASSSSVYGDTRVLPKTEDMIPNPQSPYAVTKIGGEYYCRVFARLFGLQTVSLRYFNVYGPRQDPSSEYSAVIPKFITRLLHHEPPLIFGDGSNTRDFTFVRDVVQANYLAMRSGAQGVYNVGYGQQTTITDLASHLSRLLEVSLAPRYLPPRPGDVDHSLADISAAKRDFKYSPEYPIERGLAETIPWYNRK